MPFLKKQVELVNKALLQGALADERFKAGRIETIAVDVVRTEGETRQIFPAIMNKDYQPEMISVDDTYPIIIYHKIIGSAYSPYKENTGQGMALQNQGTQVRMVVYGKYAALKMTRESLEALMITNFPDFFKQADFSGLGLSNLYATVQGSNLNSLAVWMEEYKGFPFPLGAEDIMFSITYMLNSVFKKGCFRICDCN